MPRDFNFPFGGVKMWVPLPPEAGAEPRDRGLQGLGLGQVLARLISSLLYGVGPFDLLTFVTVSAVLLAKAIPATLLPAGPGRPNRPSRRPEVRVSGRVF
jgi:hypothetical protein